MKSALTVLLPLAILSVAFVDCAIGDEKLPSTVEGAKAGDGHTIAGIEFCWCPPGRFTMGSPRGESERRPGEDQVEVTLTKGFWMAKFEATQGDWKRIVGKLPGELTAELPEGDDYPVGNVNFPEAEGFCRELTKKARASGDLPKDWEFRLPTEAQWEYACRAGTTTTTSFGDKLSSKRRIFAANPTTAPRKVRPWVARQKSEVIRRTPGDCMTCTATSTNGAAIGIIENCPAAPTPICTIRRTPPPKANTVTFHGLAAADAGRTKDGPAAPLSG